MKQRVSRKDVAAYLAQIQDAVLAKDGTLADRLLRELAAKGGVALSAFALCAGKILNGTAIVISAPEGENGMVSFACLPGYPAAPYEEPLFLSGSYKDTGLALYHESFFRHGAHSAQNAHYCGFIKDAHKALREPEALPPFDEAFRECMGLASPRKYLKKVLGALAA